MNKWKIMAGVVSVLCIFRYLGAEPPNASLSILDNGYIEGAVYDGSNGIDHLPNVRVVTFDSLNVQVAENMTDSLGRFSLSIPPGVYREHFIKIGYRSRYVVNINVAANETTHVNTTLFLMGCWYHLGDINANGRVDLLDIVYAVSYFNGGRPPPYSCECIPGHTWYVQADVNGSCTFNGLDVTYLVSYFKGGPDLICCPDCPPE